MGVRVAGEPSNVAEKVGCVQTCRNPVHDRGPEVNPITTTFGQRYLPAQQCTHSPADELKIIRSILPSLENSINSAIENGDRASDAGDAKWLTGKNGKYKCSHE